MSGKRKLPDFQKIDPHLRTHPRFVAFRDRLGIETPLAHGLLAGLWSFAFDHARDGDLSRFTPAEIASSVGWRGDADELVSALSLGFVVDGIIHDWHEWGGALFEARDKEARKKYDQYHSEQGKVSQEKTGEVGISREKIPEEKREEKIKSIVPKQASALSADFLAWWNAFGKVGSRADADLLFRYWVRNGASPDDLTIAATNYRAHCLARDSLQQHGRTFLAKTPNRWQEWVIPEEKPNGNGGNGKRRIATLDERGNTVFVEEESHA
jgi:hypothetical protein